MSNHKEYLARMERFLKEDYPECVLMPTKNNDPCFEASDGAAQGKNPLRPHKGASAKSLWNAWDLELKDLCAKGLLIILRGGLIVIDVDDNEMADELELRFPEIKDTSVQLTRHGRHYFFERSARCDEIKLWDKARSLKFIDGDGVEQTLPIDIKTVCSTGTGGVISIFPSPNKQWARAPYDHPPIVIPDTLLDFILERHKDYGFRRSQPPQQARAQPLKQVKTDDDTQSSMSMTPTSASGCSWTKMTSVSQTSTANVVVTEREVVEALVMECLSSRRADDYGDWIEVGMCLCHMSAEGDVGDLFDLWVAFSKQSPKYAGHEGECKAKWASFEGSDKRGVTERTLKLRAREDNPTAYHEILQHSLGGLIARCAAADSDHATIAMVVHRMYKDEFVCASIKNRRWYMFDAHRWRPIEEAFVLRRRMSREVASHFVKAATRIQARAGADGCDTEQRAALIKTSQRLVNIAGKLDNMRFKDAVLRECADIFYVPDFASKLDSEDRLLCFENGVYDLDAGAFRAGRPDDNLSLSVGYDYASEVVARYRGELASFVASTQTSDEMADYVLKVLAYMLHGFKYMECLWFFTGKSGRNGKGTIAALLSATLGQYYYEPNAAVFTTSDRNPSAACPEIANMKGKRCVVASEPPDTEGQTFKVNKLKNWRGNDKITARVLYADPVTFRPQFGIILMMNDKPCLDKVDRAIARTLSIVDFPFEFVDTTGGGSLAPNQKSIDAGIKQRFEQDVRYRQQFMLMLIDIYRSNHATIFGAKQPIARPQEVVDATDEYINDNNVIGEWLTTSYEATGSNTDRITAAELYRDFKSETPTSRMSVSAFKNALSFNGWSSRKSMGVMTYFGYKRRAYNMVDEDPFDM
jgi:P4 family phage/plasmid primase-like protien